MGSELLAMHLAPANRRTEPPIAQAMRQLGGPALKYLLHWVQMALNRHEVIEIQSWTEDFWYVNVKDRRIKEHPADWLMAITIDVVKDRLFWSHDKAYAGKGFTRGGNCFCRSHRWFKLLSSHYPAAKSDRKFPGVGTVHDYRRGRCT